MCGYFPDVVRKMNFYSFLLQFVSEMGWRFIVTPDIASDTMEIPGKGTHSDASDSYEIDVMYLVQVHLINASTSSAMSFVAFALASFLMASASCFILSGLLINSENTLWNLDSSSDSRNRMAAPLSAIAFAFFV